YRIATSEGVNSTGLTIATRRRLLRGSHDTLDRFSVNLTIALILAHTVAGLHEAKEIDARMAGDICETHFFGSACHSTVRTSDRSGNCQNRFDERFKRRCARSL